MIVSQKEDGETRAVLPSVLAFVQRRRIVLAVPTLAGLVIGIVSYANAPYSYVSEAVLAPDVRRVQALPSESVVAPLPQDSPVLRTELDVITSRMMAAKVVARLEGAGLEIRNDPPSRSIVASMLKSLRQSLVANAGPSGQVSPPDPKNDRIKIDRLLDNLRVSNDGRSYTIYISYRASDPVYAAKVANAYAESYLDHQISVQRSATRRVSDWLGETLLTLRADLESSERALEKFRQEAGLLRADGVTLQAQRVSALNAQLVEVRTELSGATARLETMLELARNSEVPSSTEVLASPAIQNLRADQVRLERKIEELRGSGAVKSAQLTVLSAELGSLKEQLEREVDRIVESLSNEITIARNKEASLRKALADAQSELAKASHAEVTMAQLEREAYANRTIYESYLVRYKQTVEQDGIAAPEAQIISFAEPATARASPKLSTSLLLGLGFGGSFALAGAILRDATDRRRRLPEALLAATGVPVIGIVRRLPADDHQRLAKEAQNATTPFGGALSTLRATLHRTVGSTHPALAIVSTFDGDGKTTLAIGLARNAAAAGARVAIIDGNLRKPALERAFGVKASRYLDEILDPGCTAIDLLQADPKSGLQFIAARTGMVAPETLLSIKRMQSVLSELKRHFDLVLVDTPSMEEAADAVSIAAAADHAVFIVNYKAARLHEITPSIRSLSASGRTPEGLVLSQVDRRSFNELAERTVQPPVRLAAATAITRPNISSNW